MELVAHVVALAQLNHLTEVRVAVQAFKPATFVAVTSFLAGSGGAARALGPARTEPTLDFPGAYHTGATVQQGIFFSKSCFAVVSS